MTGKKKRPTKKTEATEPVDLYRQQQERLRAAQEALTAAENPNTFNEWLSPRQKYTVLDHIDEMMEELLHDIRYAPGLHIAPGVPDLTPALNILLAELRGRIMRRLHLGEADKQLRRALGLDR